MRKRYKIFYCLILAVLMIALSLIPSFATKERIYNKGELIDHTGTISSESANRINRLIDEAYEKYNCSVIIYYTNYVNSNDSIRDDDAERMYLNGNYCESGVLLYLGTISRSFDIYVRHGEYVGKITYDEGDRLNGAIMPLLRANNFDGAAVKFAELALEFSGNSENERFIVGKSMSSCLTYALISLIIGAVISLVVVLSMRSKMDTVKKQRGASRYFENRDITITESRDRFLYSTLTKVPKPDSSSGGRSGGGSGGHSGGGSHHGGHF